MTGLIPFFRQNGGERLLDSPFLLLSLLLLNLFLYIAFAVLFTHRYQC
jgi:hypothetical protein